MKFLDILIVFVILQNATANEEIKRLLPDISDHEALSIIQGPAFYAGSDLFTMIDGGAEVYLEYGFEVAANAAYLLDNDIRIEFQLYQMKDAGAAFGIFSSSRSKSDSIIYKEPELKLINDYYTMFQKGKYFGVLSWNGSNAKTNTIINDIRESVLRKIQTAEPLPDLVKKYIDAGRSVNNLKYIRGTIALSGSYFFSQQDIFNIDEALCIEDDNKKLIVFEYKDTTITGNTFSQVKSGLSGSSRIHDYKENEDVISYIDRKNRIVRIEKLKTSLTALIIEGESDTEDKPSTNF
ncbi:MAG: hypothetical protein JW894_15750 [Bacteroidales bacterium]|nr:hypothetical protein [Bacteroidales bacterium]